jgi:leucyl aminopeptidase
VNVDVTGAEPAEVVADVLAVPVGGALVQELDSLFGGRLARAAADADPVAVLHVGDELRARRVAAVVVDTLDAEGLRAAAARAVRAQKGRGTVAWALDESLPCDPPSQVQALIEGAVLGNYRADRWKSGGPARGVDDFVVCGAREELRPVAARAEVVARWTNVARELVDAPPNVRHRRSSSSCATSPRTRRIGSGWHSSARPSRSTRAATS